MEKFIKFSDINTQIELFGLNDENIHTIEDEFDIKATSHDCDIKLIGNPENVTKAEKAIACLVAFISKGESVTPERLSYVFNLVNTGTDNQISALTDAACILITSKGKPIKPKTIGQTNYLKAIENNTITLCCGPAGTGKTYLAVAMAVKAYKQKNVGRIILTRPAVEAGETLGFLPGDLQQKVDPYLRPLYDALFDMLGAEAFARMQEKGEIEVAPLAYMRGRTLDDSFIILDEAQNTTNEQMKMFLTRLGFNSKAVVTGDLTQIDLPQNKKSGLVGAVKILKGIKDISVTYLSSADVVRHRLIQDIIKAYDKYNNINNH